MSVAGMDLAPWQRRGAARLGELMRDGGGWAVLGDSPGLGKTRTVASALWALCEGGAGAGVVVEAPPATLGQWRAELSLWGLDGVVLLSHGVLRRRQPRLPVGGVLVVDEAHHFRNPRTEGYRRLSLVASRCSRVLLVTATPVHNRAADALAMVELCGVSTGDLSDPVGVFRSRLVRHRAAEIRRRWPEEAGRFGGPLVRVIRRRSGVHVEGVVVDAVRRFCGEHHGAFRSSQGALERILLQRLLSSPAALRATLRRLERYLVRSEELLLRGRCLDARTWRRLFEGDHDGEGTQEWLSFVVDDAVGLAPQGSPGSGLKGVLAARTALVELVACVGPGPGELDGVLATAMRSECEASRFVLVFTEYRDTARALWRSPPSGLRLGFLTGSEGAFPGSPVRSAARVASDLLAAVVDRGGCGTGLRDTSPGGGAQLELGVGGCGVGGSSAARARLLDGLVLTGGWCEGINLPGIELVVHWDLPPTPARVVQRTGRVQRRGTSRVVEWLRVPTGEVAGQLRVLERLEVKRRVSRLVADGAGEGVALCPESEVFGLGSEEVEAADRWASGGLSLSLRTGCHREAVVWLRLRGQLRRRLSVSHGHLRLSVLSGWRSSRGGFEGDVVDGMRLCAILERELGWRGGLKEGSG